MNLEISWWDALNVHERTALGKPHMRDDEFGKVAFTRWSSLPAFRENSQEALGVLGHTEESFLDVLSETPSSLADRAPEEPVWFSYFVEVLASGRDQQLDSSQPDSELGLLAFVGPVLRGAQIRLAQNLEKLCGEVQFTGASSTTIINAILGSLPFDQISQMATRVAVLRMHQAKAASGLEGAESSERYQYFIGTLEDPRVQDEIFSEYPVLVRSIAEKLMLWEESRIEFYERFAADFQSITELGLISAKDEIEHVHFGAGDTHQRGRTVTLIESATGGLVYKPRPGIGDIAFQKLVTRTNQLTKTLTMGHPKVLDKGAYSWHQKVLSKPVDSSNSEVCAQNLGGLTALLHLLQANDFHHENIIFSGDTPYAIDTETLFHTELSMATEDAMEPRFSVARYRDSTATVGILPSKTVTANGDEVFATDISAMGYTPGQRSMIKIPTVNGLGTDEMTFSSGYAHEPQDEDFTPHELIHKGEAFTEGYREVIEAWSDNLEELVGQGGLLDHFVAFHAREIPRPTMVYSKVLMESYHPDFMRDGRDRDLVLGKLLKGYSNKPHRATMLVSELNSLRIGDIPFFTRGVMDADSEGASPLEQIKERIRSRISTAERAFETSNIELALVAAGSSPFGANSVPRPGIDGVGHMPAAVAKRLARTQALDLARYLDNIAPRDSEGVPAWLSLSVLPGDMWTVSPTSIDFYSGMTGIHSALLGVRNVLNAPELDSLLDGMEVELSRFEQILRNGLDDHSLFKDQVDCGGYGQLGGFAVASAQTLRRNGRAPDISRLELALELLEEVGPKAPENDVISGLAGGILAAVSTLDVAEPERVRTVIATLAKELVDRSVQAGNLMYWIDGETGQGLTGFSHGTAGIALALTHAGVLLEEPDYLECAQAALAYDDSSFDPATGDWADLRESGGAPPMRAWCHGAPGGLLARAEIARLAPHVLGPQWEQIRSSALTALVETLCVIQPEAVNDSLCHGLVGNAVILQYLLDSGIAPSHYQAVVDEALTRVLQSAAEFGWRSGALRGVAIPDALMGLSGIAWGLAVLGASTRETFNILSLAPWSASTSLAKAATLTMEQTCPV